MIAYQVIIAGEPRKIFQKEEDARKELYTEMYYNSPLTQVEAAAWVRTFKTRPMCGAELYSYGWFGIKRIQIN